MIKEIQLVLLQLNYDAILPVLMRCLTFRLLSASSSDAPFRGRSNNKRQLWQPRSEAAEAAQKPF